MKILYQAVATATGGRDGHVKSENGVLDLEMRLPVALGGSSDHYANPEMLFAAGYSACFESALNLVIQSAKIQPEQTTVTAKVGIGRIAHGAFKLEIELEIKIPGIGRELASELVEKADQICPYSNAIRGNVDVNLLVTN